MGRRKRNVVPWLEKLKKTPTLSQGQSDLVKWVFLVSRKPPHPIYLPILGGETLLL